MRNMNNKLQKFKSQEEEADFWMKHDTAKFWDAFEDIKEPIEVSTDLMSVIKARHEKTKQVNIRLYPTQIRLAKVIANKKHTPYQSIIRNIIEQGLLQLSRELGSLAPEIPSQHYRAGTR